MANFCTNCGKPVSENVRFCTNCGHPLTDNRVKKASGEAQKTEQMQQTSRPDMEKSARVSSSGKYCTKCGRLLPAGATYCTGCGHSRAGFGAQPVQEPLNQSENVFRLTAPSSAGEFEAGVFRASGVAAGMAGNASEILSPGKTLSTFFGSMGGKLKALFTGKNAKGLIVAAALAVVWIILLVMRREGIGGPIRNVLDVLFFGQGGVSSNVLCVIGGLLGKFTLAAAAAALVSGGAKNIGAGFKNLFSRKNFRKNTIGLYLLGAGAALLFYQFFAWTASYKDIMASVAGAAVSVMALGGRNGLLRKLASSVTAKKNGNQRIGQGEKSNALLAGLASGFALGVPLSFIGFGLLPLAVGGSILVVGLILALIFGNTTEKAAGPEGR